MPYIITFVDAANILEKKKEFRAVHIAYVAAHASRILASGGLFPDDDDFPDGGMTILNTESRQDAVEFIEQDPFFTQGIFTTYTIHRWKKAIWDFQRA